MAERNGISAKLWLALLKEGGRVTALEAAELAPEADKATVRANLNSLADSGALRKFEPEPGKLGTKFGVTSACKVPHGVTIADILACNLLEGAE